MKMVPEKWEPGQRAAVVKHKDNLVGWIGLNCWTLFLDWHGLLDCRGLLDWHGLLDWLGLLDCHGLLVGLSWIVGLALIAGLEFIVGLAWNVGLLGTFWELYDNILSCRCHLVLLRTPVPKLRSDAESELQLPCMETPFTSRETSSREPRRSSRQLREPLLSGMRTI